MHLKIIEKKIPHAFSKPRSYRICWAVNRVGPDDGGSRNAISRKRTRAISSTVYFPRTWSLCKLRFMRTVRRNVRVPFSIGQTIAARTFVNFSRPTVTPQRTTSVHGKSQRLIKSPFQKGTSSRPHPSR